MGDAAAPITIQPIPEPEQMLDPRAMRQWVVEEILSWLVLVPVVVGIVTGAKFIFDFSWRWPILAAVGMLVLAVGFCLVNPRLRYRQWRYAIRESEVDLRFGIFTRTRQLVPIARVQHVDTRRGPLQRRYGLASVVLYTAAGSVEIPALSVEVADEVRDRIATLANVRDDL